MEQGQINRPYAAAKAAVAALLALSAIASAAISGDQALSPRVVVDSAQRYADSGEEVFVDGIVTFVSRLTPGKFIIAPLDQTYSRGLVVIAAAGVRVPHFADRVQTTGTVRQRNGRPELDARRIEVVRSNNTVTIKGVKQADFRRGKLAERLVSLFGTVSDIQIYETSNGPVTTLSVFMDSYNACVRVPGVLDGDKLLGKQIMATGCPYNVFGAEGNYLDSELEVPGPEAIQMLEPETPAIIKVVLIALSCGLAIGIAVMAMLWLRSRRQKHEFAVIAAERRRMAADLHDTIEQYLAGANLVAAGVLALEDVPDDVVEAMKSLTALLANAKAEVKSAVTKLRADKLEARTPAERISEVASGIAKTGVEVRKKLRGLPEHMGASECHNMLQIIREAATNAVKHGKASHVVITADPLPGGGFTLSVLNDGEPFDVSRALGPETGHFGLSGMRERALRSGFEIEWGQHGRWTFVRINAGMSKKQRGVS